MRLLTIATGCLFFTFAGCIASKLNEVADTLQRMAGVAPTGEQRLEYCSESIDWRERSLSRSWFMCDWAVGQRRAAGLATKEKGVEDE